MRKRIYIPAVVVMLVMALLVWKYGRNSPQTVVQAVPELATNTVASDRTDSQAGNQTDGHIVTGHAMSVVMPSLPSSNSPEVVSEAEIRQRIETARNQTISN
jgi:hypothetical protein